jgi:hypothetical protein
MREIAEHRGTVAGWTLDLGRPMRAELDEEVHWLFEALDEALALTGEEPEDAGEPRPLAVVWRDATSAVRLVVLPGDDAEEELARSRGRRLRVEQDPFLLTLLTSGWERHEQAAAPQWILRARGGAPGTLALLFVTSHDEGDGPWARGVARSLRYRA